MGVWQGVAMDSLEFHPGLSCTTLLHPVGGLPLIRHYSLFRGDPPADQAACGRLLPFWTPHAVRLCVLITLPILAGNVGFVEQRKTIMVKTCPGLINLANLPVFFMILKA
jgi:hypothetical protein